MRGHRIEMLTVILVLTILLNGIWVFMDDNNAEPREYDQKHEPCRAGVFYLGREVMVCTVMFNKD